MTEKPSEISFSSASIDCPAHCKQINSTSGNRNIARALNVASLTLKTDLNPARPQ